MERRPFDAPGMPVDDERSAARRDRDVVIAERQRIYRTSAWVGPVGTVGLTTIIVAHLDGDVRRSVLVVWAVVLGTAVAGQVASIRIPRVRSWVAPNGLPRVTQWAHLLIGVAYGALPWMSSDIVERAELRWLVLMAMFAMSAGVSTGLAGLNSLALRVIVPMWVLVSSALFVGGVWPIGLGAVLFVIIQIVDQRRTGLLWQELVELRVEHERRTEEQRWQAEHDMLTGALNRAGIRARLEGVAGRPATAMYVDLDHFKVVNDDHGHAVGDEVLEIASRLGRLADATDIVGRLGGDEFLVVFDRALPADRIVELGEELIADLERPIETTAGSVRVSASVGAATLEEGGVGARDLLVLADHAMLRAKRLGGRRLELSSADLDA